MNRPSETYNNSRKSLRHKVFYFLLKQPEAQLHSHLPSQIYPAENSSTSSVPEGILKLLLEGCQRNCPQFQIESSVTEVNSSIYLPSQVFLLLKIMVRLKQKDFLMYRTLVKENSESTICIKGLKICFFLTNHQIPF